MLVLAVGAHPDDETFAGGLLARYASEGHEVRLLLTTRGEGGFPGEPPLCERSELGAIREAEARESGRILGASEVRFLPFRDPDLVRGRLQPIAASLDEFSGAIAAEIAVSRPDVVVTHGSGGEYGHPQHTYTHRAVFAALARLQPWRPREVWTWCAAYSDPEHERNINHDDPADLVLDITPWLAQKVSALAAHRTQFLMLTRNSPVPTLEAVAGTIESFRRWPPVRPRVALTVGRERIAAP